MTRQILLRVLGQRSNVDRIVNLFGAVVLETDLDRVELLPTFLDYLISAFVEVLQRTLSVGEGFAGQVHFYLVAHHPDRVVIVVHTRKGWLAGSVGGDGILEVSDTVLARDAHAAARVMAHGYRLVKLHLTHAEE